VGLMEIIKAVKRHDCYEELPPAQATDDLWYGSEVRCSCGQDFMLEEDQRDGDYWLRITKPIPQSKPGYSSDNYGSVGWGYEHH